MTKRMPRLLRLALINLVIGFVCFLLLAVNALTSDYDGLWYADALYLSGAWELSLGRFMIPVIDSLRAGFNGEPLQSLLTLSLLAAGNVLVLELFSFAESGTAIPVLALLTANSTVCIFLSFRYTAPAYGLSYLFAVLSLFPLVKNDRDKKDSVRNVMVSALFLTLCLGTYQAHLGCACLLVAFLALSMLAGNETPLPSVFRFLIKSGSAVLVSCAVYKIIWDIALKAARITRPDYRGAGDLSVLKILRGIPYGVRLAFRFFYVHCFKTDNRYSMFQDTPVHVAVLVFGALLLVLFVFRIMKHDTKKGALAALLVLCLPPAAGIFCLLDIETGFVSMQMTMPYTMIAPLMVILFSKQDPAGIRGTLPRYASVLFLVTVLYGRVYQAGIDQYVMFEGTRTTRNLVQAALTRVYDEGLYAPERKVFPVGVPSENPLFLKSALFEKANPYARFGAFWKGPYSYWRSYGGLLRSTGVNIPLPDLETCVAITESEEVKRMPLYPDSGSIRLVGDVIVIKFADEE